MDEEARWLSLCHGFVGGGLAGGERERVMVVCVVEGGRVRRERRVKRERREGEVEAMAACLICLCD